MYLPRILLCGSVKKFLAAAQGRAIKVVGRISFKGAAERGEFVMPANAAFANAVKLKPDDFRIFLNGAEISVANLRGLLDGAADYIVFEDHDAYLMRFRELYALKLIDRVVTAQTLLRHATDNFFSPDNAVQIFNLIHALKLPRTLDADGFFAKNDYHMFPDMKSKIAGIIAEVDYPAIENFYAQIYPSPDACRLKHFDALLLSAERTPAEFIAALIDFDSLAENIFAFVRRGSALEEWLATNGNVFASTEYFPAVNGHWALLKKFVRADFAGCVVTHKDAQLSDLPEGYRIIHAGHAQAKEDFGCLGDDTGDNISRLNPYLNELTALYWIWKNTRHSMLAFVHYRRFFTLDGKNILTGDDAAKILRDFDIIVNECRFGHVALYDWKIMLSTRKLAEHVMSTVRKHIARRQPDYLSAYDRVNNGFGTFCYGMFAARRKVFDSYCEWLFSFIIDATEEILATTDIASSDDPRTYRAVGFLAEHLLGVWIIKNRLKIKTLPVIFRNNV